MPKEVTYGDAPYGGKWKRDPDGPEIEIHVPVVSVVEVRWDRETGYFQIATLMHDSSNGGVVTEFPKELREVFGEPATAEEKKEQEAAFLASASGWYVTLDRQGINRLIRNLRRARDQAFGRDE